MSCALAGRPLRLVVFDMDGVLVSTSPCHARAYAELWDSLGVEGPAYEAIAGRRTAEVVAEVTAPLAPAAERVAEWTDIKQQRARELLAVADLEYPDTRACLDTLAGQGVPMALGTAASGATTRTILERLGLAAYFDCVVTAEDIVNGKPAPDVYRRIIETLAAPAGETLVVEDSDAGLRAAAAAGALSVSVRTGLEGAPPDFIGAYRDLAALQQVLECWA